MMKLTHTVALVVATFALGACSSPAEREARALRKGAEYFAAENWEKARVEYRNALQAVPNDGEARYRNGLVAEKLGQARDAVQFYMGALEVKPDLVDARARLGRLYVVGGVPERALDVVNTGLEKTPADAGLLAVRAAARARLKDIPGALEDAEKAAALNPRDENTVAVLAGLYTATGQLDRAAVLLGVAIREIPATTDLRTALAQIEIKLGRPERAESLLREVIRLRPKDSATRLAFAQFLAQSGKGDAAERVLIEGRKLLPKDAVLRRALVEFLSASRGRAAGEAELLRMIATEPDDVDLKLSLAAFYLQGNEAPKAEAVLAEVIKSEGARPAGLIARTRLAAARLSAGDSATAEKLVDEVIVKSARDPDALMLRGNLRLAKGDAKGAIEDLRAASRDIPNSRPLLQALARAHLKNGEPALAEESLRRAIEIDPSAPSPRADLVSLLEESDRRPEAAQMLRQMGQQFPKDVQVQSAVLRAGLAARDFDMATSAVRAIEALPDERARGKVFAGLVAEAQGHTDDALGLYRNALDLSPQIPEALAQATKLLIARKRLPDALKLLDEIATKAPAYALPLTLKGDALLAERNFPGAEEAFRGAIARSPRWWLPQRGLAYVTLGRGDNAGAIRALQDSAAKVDEGWRLQAAAGQLLELTGHPDEAIAAYDKALSDAGSVADATGAANNLAMLLVTQRSDPDSLKRALRLTEHFAGASNPLVLDTYGWVRFKSGDVPGALAALERANSITPSQAIINYHLGVVQESAGKADKAVGSLRAAVRSGQSFPGLQDAAARLERLKVSVRE
jgi:tetratricopeptide (TPR) repeat protein